MSYIQKECEYCNKNIFITIYRLKEGRGKFCSKICFHKAFKEFPKYKKIQENAAKSRIGIKENKEIRNKRKQSRNRYTNLLIGKIIKSKNYKLIYDPNHFTHEYGNYVAEHRYVIERLLNRPLKRNEHVHHINKNKHDNKISNLMVLNSNSAHKRMDWGIKVCRKEIVFDGRNY